MNYVEKVTSHEFGIKTKAIVSGEIYIYFISTVNCLDFCITVPILNAWLSIAIKHPYFDFSYNV